MANIRIAELDFDYIKKNLKDFLRGQEEFSDYDFEGSGLAVLLDILAYNTHYNAYLANMLANEMFLDSAVKRESAVSLAKHLQYTPRSVISSLARVNLRYTIPQDFVGTPPPSITIDRYSVFKTTINGIQYQFSNLEPHTAQLNGNTYYFDDITIREGIPVTNVYTVTETGTNVKYEVLNDNADITTLRVYVQKNSLDSTTTYFTRAIDDAYTVNATQISGQDKVFFLEQNPFNRYEIFFGDGKIGSPVAKDNIIFLQYLVSNGSKTNVSTTIGSGQIFSGPVVNSLSPIVETIESSNGGKEAEKIEEIKFNAPRAYAAQNRLVTVEDYKSILRREVPNIQALSVWGGEDNNPPQYGKVFISILPTSGNVLTQAIKNRIRTDVLGGRRVLSITPEIVDPEYFWVNVDTTVKYDPKKTILTSDQLRDKVETNIRKYFNDNLNTFGEDFIHSRFVSEIDCACGSIVGNLTKAHLQVRFTPSLKIANSNRFVFNNVLHRDHMESTRFIVNKNGILYQARIKDEHDEATVLKSGTYRRSGTIITCNFTTAHGLTVDEEVFLEFTSAAVDGNYKIYKVNSPTSFSVISTQSGSASGSVFVTSKTRGMLKLYNPITQEIISNNVGFISYYEGIVQITNMFVVGFPSGINDIKITMKLEDDSRDIITKRNQIIRLDDSIAKPTVSQLSGLTITMVPIE